MTFQRYDHASRFEKIRAQVAEQKRALVERIRRNLNANANHEVSPLPPAEPAGQGSAFDPAAATLPQDAEDTANAVDVVIDLDKPEPPPAPSADWLCSLGLGAHSELDEIATQIAMLRESQRGTVHIQLEWPSPPPDALLAWAVHSILPIPDTEAARILFLNYGPARRKPLTTTTVVREQVSALWTPRDTASSINSERLDAMRTAFFKTRLRDDAPSELPISDIIPSVCIRHSNEQSFWASKWDGFLSTARHSVDTTKAHSGRYGFKWQGFGTSASCRPFAFLIPKASTEVRRSAEIATIPGEIDAIIVDLSARSLAPSDAAEATEECLYDLEIAFNARGADDFPPTMILLSEPRSAIAVAGILKRMRAADYSIADVKQHRRFCRSDLFGRPLRSFQNRRPAITIKAAATSEAEVSKQLLDLAAEVKDRNPDTAAALASAAFKLNAMALTTQPPLLRSEANDGPMQTFLDQETAVREAIGHEGDIAQRRQIDDALAAGRELSKHLLRQTPARIALMEASALAVAGKRVAFVTDLQADAITAARDAPAGLLVTFRNAALEAIDAYQPDLLVVVCRGQDAMRLICELSSIPPRTEILLTPLEAEKALEIANLTLEWPEMAQVHSIMQAVKKAMPPPLRGVLGLSRGFSGQTKGRPSSTSDASSRPEIIATLDDDTKVEFAEGAEVVTIANDPDSPIIKRALQLEEGDTVVLLPSEVETRIARTMGWVGGEAQIDADVFAYKESVRRWRYGSGAGLSATKIARRMHELDSNITLPSHAAIRYWLSAADDQVSATPRASSDPGWLKAFCAVIGHECDAKRLSINLDMHRNKLRRSGFLKSCLVERFLFDRYAAQLGRGVDPTIVRGLRQEALGHIKTVTSLQRIKTCGAAPQ